MYGACNELFACSCFTRDEDRRITRCDFGDARENTFQSGRCSNDLFKHRGFVDFFAQSDVFVTKLVFRLLAVFDICRGNIPTRNLSLFVAQWVKAHQEPAISSITFAHSQFQLESGATGASVIGISARRTFSVIRMKKRRERKQISGCLPPLFKTKADVLEPNAVGIETFATRSEDNNNLRNEVEYLTELRFLPPDPFFSSSALRDVDHSTGVLNELAERAENRMTNAVNVPDGATRMHNAIIGFFVQPVMSGHLGRFPERRLIVGMNPLDEFFGSGQTIPWIKTHNAVAFLRPMPDVGVWTPCPTAGVAQPLRFRQVRFTAPEGFLGRLALGDVGHRPDKLAIARCIPQKVSYGVDVLDSPIRQQQAIGVLEICRPPRGTIDDLLKVGPVLRMDA